VKDPRLEELALQLTRVLHEQRARIRGRFLVHGLGWIVATLAAAIAVYYLIDRWLHLPAAVRIVLSLLIVTYLVMCWRRRVVYPLNREFSRDDTALAIERRFPDLHERLISAIQLMDQLAAAGADAESVRGQSAAMIEKLVAEAATAVPTLPLSGLLDPARTRRVWGLAGLALLAVAVETASAPASMAIFARRTLGFDVPYPRETMLFLELDQADKDLKIRSDGRTTTVTMATGGDLAVIVRAEGKVPREAQLVVTAGRGIPPQIAMTARGQGRFRYVFRRVAGPMRFHARGGDDDRGDREVVLEVVRPPAVAGIRATIKPPAYTRREPYTVATGSLEAFEGSSVVVDVLPLPPAEDGLGTARACTIAFLESGKQLELAATTIQDDGGTKNAFRGEFLVDRSERYEVNLLGDQGLAAPHPSSYSLVVIPDYPPVGRVLMPADDNLNVLLPKAVVPIRVEARDDHGLASAKAVFTIGKAQTTFEVVLLAADAGPEKGTTPLREAWFCGLLDLVGSPTESRKGLIAALGDSVALTVHLEDHKPPQGAVTKLPGRSLNVVSETDFARRVASHFRSVRDDVEAALQQQQERLDRAKEILDDDQDAKWKGVPVQTILVSLAAGQGRVQSLVDRVHVDLMRSFCLHLFNRVEESQHAARAIELWLEWHRANAKGNVYEPAFFTMLAQERKGGRLGAMEKYLDPILEMVLVAQGLLEAPLPAALRALTEAGVADASAPRKAALKFAMERQATVIEGLKALLARLDEWNEFLDVVTQTRAVRDKQRDILNRTKSLNQGTGR